MRAATYDEVVTLLGSRPGAPKYWAGVFVKAKLSLRAVEIYLETSELDVNSPLRAGKCEFLGKELQDLKDAYGVEGDTKVYHSDEVVRYLASTAEQDAITREVSHYATVKFKPARTATYSAHVVARSIRMINSRYLLRLVPRGMRILEAGADLKSLPFRPLELANYRAAVPNLDVRDVVRHSFKKVCERILASDRSDPRAVQRAKQLMEDPLSVLEYGLVQDSHWKADAIVTNDASHDIPFGDMPKVMADKGASMWVGAMMRVKGLSRFSKFTVGEVPVLGARYRIDYAADKISFHFKSDASFGYTHKLSELRRYEEHTDYVFRAGVYDYIYTKLPATTDSTLFFCVYRVPSMPCSLVEPSYAETGSAGKVLVRSIKAVGDDASGLPRMYAPYEFEMDEEIYEKVAERRHSLGVSGNLAVTMSYMRSVRVKFYVNGESIGAEHRMGQELLESAAVAIEVVVAENRRSVEASLQMIEAAHTAAVRNIVPGSLLKRVLVQACDYRRVSGLVRDCVETVWSSVRTKLVQAALNSTEKLVVEIVKQSAYVRIPNEAEELRVGVAHGSGSSCKCAEEAEVRAALQFGELDKEQVAELTAYLAHLNSVECPVCGTVDSLLTSVGERVRESEDDDQEFYDASTDFSCDADQSIESDSLSSETDATSLELNGPDVVDTVIQAVDEYASLQRFLSQAVKSKVKRDASILFKMDVPTELELLRFSTGRVRHYAVQLVNGELVKVIGGVKPCDLMACYDFETMRLHWVQKRSGKVFVASGESKWMYSCSSLEVFNNDALASMVECVLSDATGVYDPAEQLFVQGVPGAGKTYEIVSEMLSRKDATTVLYLSATVSSADDVRSRVYGDVAEGKLRVRTLDSYTLGSVVAAEEVWVDEVCMAHAGQVYAALIRTMPSKVRFYGDFEQVPFCSFTSDAEFRVLFASMKGRIPTVHRAVTHRCPPDVCRMWADRYDGQFFPCDCHTDGRPERSLSVKQIRSAADIVYDSDVRYMVYTHNEKRELHQALGFGASVEVLRLRRSSGLATVHEDQGSTHRRVALVRLVARYDPKQSELAPSIYNRLAYALTASTRHTHEFVYYTTSLERDVMVERISSNRI